MWRVDFFLRFLVRDLPSRAKLVQKELCFFIFNSIEWKSGFIQIIHVNYVITRDGQRLILRVNH